MLLLGKTQKWSLLSQILVSKERNADFFSKWNHNVIEGHDIVVINAYGE